MRAVSRPRIMGIVNLTPDSFSDGAEFLDPKAAIKHACALVAEGADIIDLGAESTRPGAAETAPELEQSRILPVLTALRNKYPSLSISIDTRNASTARACIEKGATMINDVSALGHDPKMSELLAEYPEVELILMHMQGDPQTMQLNPHYEDLGSELISFFRERIEHCRELGIKKLYLDPGIGFGKTLSHNLSILRNLDKLRSLGEALLLGVSRKSFIDKIHPAQPKERLGGSLAALVPALQAGVSIVRVHDVAATKQFLKVYEAIITEAEWNS